MTSCSIKNCKSKGEENSDHFYKFPDGNEKIMKCWIKATGRDNWIPCPNARICRLHFTNDDYCYDTDHKKCLKLDVIPTQHLHLEALTALEQPEDEIEEYSKDMLYNKLLRENERLRKEKEDLKISLKEQLLRKEKILNFIFSAHNIEMPKMTEEKLKKQIKATEKLFEHRIEQTERCCENLKIELIEELKKIPLTEAKRKETLEKLLSRKELLEKDT